VDRREGKGRVPFGCWEMDVPVSSVCRWFYVVVTSAYVKHKFSGVGAFQFWRLRLQALQFSAVKTPECINFGALIN